MDKLGRTIRVVQLDETDQARWNDELHIIHKDDTSGSVDGTDKRISVRNFIETSPVRASTDKSVVKQLAIWIGEFKSKIEALEVKTKQATTNIFGITRLATDAQAKAKTVSNRTVTPSNFKVMDSSENYAGFLALANKDEVLEGNVNNKAISPKNLFDSILGDAVLGNNKWTFKFPAKNVVGDIKMEFVVQVGHVEFITMKTEMDPQTNFNHIHETQEIKVTFPEKFQSYCLMVIPFGFEATPSEYTEATDFWFRPYDITKTGATLRASRINGVSDGTEEAAVRYLAIGY